MVYTEFMVKEKTKVVAKESSGNIVYCFGIIGAAVYYIDQANGFWEVILAILKALIWPVFAVYEVLKHVGA